MGKCQMCGIESDLTKHHLRPVETCRNKYKKLKTDESNFIWICRQCHDAIHATYGNNYIRDNLDTLDKLLADEKLKKFVNWRKKHPSFNGHSKMSQDQKKHRG